jgi:transcription initiation factor IIE alpha subunit
VTADWPLMRRILIALHGDDGLTDFELAERPGVPTTEIRQAARVLYRQRRVDFCHGRVTLVPPKVTSRGAA